jgi:hypothetical protein
MLLVPNHLPERTDLHPAVDLGHVYVVRASLQPWLFRLGANSERPYSVLVI